MRILHVLPTYFPAVRYGGPIYSVHALARALKRRGHQVHVYTTNVDGASISPVPLQRPVDIDGVEVWYFSTGLGRRIYRSPTMGRAFRNNLAGFDILHLHSVFLWPTSAAAHIARQCDLPYILTPRGMLVRDLIRRKNSVIKHYGLHSSSVATSNMRLQYNLLPKLRLTNSSRLAFVSAIPSSCRTESMSRRCNLSLQNPIVADRIYCTWDGSVGRNGSMNLFAPPRSSADVDLVIAGNDDEGLRPELDKLVRQRGLSDRVHFVGHVEGTRKWDLFREAKLFVLPSQSENFGVAVLEAMSVGCPVIVTSEVGLSSSVRETGAGLVIQAHPDAIANAINRLMANADMRHQMGEAGRRAAKELFSWDAIAHETENLYTRHRAATRESSALQ